MAILTELLQNSLCTLFSSDCSHKFGGFRVKFVCLFRLERCKDATQNRNAHGTAAQDRQCEPVVIVVISHLKSASSSAAVWCHVDEKSQWWFPKVSTGRHSLGSGSEAFANISDQQDAGMRFGISGP
jgi:hypothetical protein